MLSFSAFLAFAHIARPASAAAALIDQPVSDRIAFAAAASVGDLFYRFHTSERGLNREAVLLSREDHGRNLLSAAEQGALRRVLSLGRGPLAMQRLLGTNLSSYLQRLVGTTCHVVRSASGEKPIRAAELVAGDIVRLTAGDIVPADVRLIEATDDLLLDQSVLAGERDVQKKEAERLEDAVATPADCVNIAFAGTRVASGEARGVVVAVGAETLLGSASQQGAAPAARAGQPRMALQIS